MKHLLYLVALLVIMPPLVDAAEDAGEAFQCSFTISAGQQSLRRFTLTGTVYECMRHTGYADLTIVNAAGDIVPFRIKIPGATVGTRRYRQELRTYREPGAPEYRTGEQLRRLARLTGIDAARRDDAAWQQENRFYSSLILERQGTEDELRSIVFDTDTDAVPVTATVTVEESDDLQHWTTRLEPRALHFLPGKEGRLRNNVLSLVGGSRAKYLRIAMLSNIEHFAGTITRVTGEYEQAQHTPADWQWIAVQDYRPLETESEWAVALPGLFPVSRLRFRPADHVVFYKGSLYANVHVNPVADTEPRRLHREGRRKLKRIIKNTLQGDLKLPPEQDPWRYVAAFTQYRLITDTGTLNSADLRIARRQSRHWKLSFEQPATVSRHTLPAVEFGWQPPEVTFVAQGLAPFHLLVGRDKPVSRAGYPGSLNTVDAQPVKLLPIAAAPGETPDEYIEPTSEEPQQWATIALWLVLVAGVALMGVMAYRLVKSMKAG